MCWWLVNKFHTCLEQLKLISQFRISKIKHKSTSTNLLVYFSFCYFYLPFFIVWLLKNLPHVRSPHAPCTCSLRNYTLPVSIHMRSSNLPHFSTSPHLPMLFPCSLTHSLKDAQKINCFIHFTPTWLLSWTVKSYCFPIRCSFVCELDPQCDSLWSLLFQKSCSTK